MLASCSKDDKPKDQNSSTNNQQKNQQDDEDNPADTNLTPEEKFSAAIMIDFLNDSDDEEVADYLETEIYKMGLNYTGASVVELFPSVWLVMLEKEGVTKNYLLQKFVNVQSNEDYFRLKETSITITDIISRGKPILPAGK
jgi:hypothetical protein